MTLTTKFNLVLVPVFLIALVLAGYLSYTILQNNARQQVIAQAGLMMEAALAVRGYTVGEIKPLLVPHMQDTFLPQTVPAYAATQAFNKLRETHPEYAYKEATLNPTNPRDRAVDWETDIVQYFRNQQGQEDEIIGERTTPTGRSLYLARPIQIKNPGCLTCHSTVDAAPKTMRALYGDANGFGWNLNEVVGAQIVSVPMSVPIEQARQAFYTFMGSLVGVFLVVLILVSVMLRQIVTQPLSDMAKAADAVSKGQAAAPNFPLGGKDEIAVLANSFRRMCSSLNKAMKLLNE